MKMPYRQAAALSLMLGLVIDSAQASLPSERPTEKLSATERLFTCEKIDKRTIKAALVLAPEIVSYDDNNFKKLNAPMRFWGQHITQANVYINEGEQEINWRYASTLPFETLRTKLKLPKSTCPSEDMCESWKGFTSKAISRTPAGLQVSCLLQYHGNF